MFRQKATQHIRMKSPKPLLSDLNTVLGGNYNGNYCCNG
jgi:hypothetical protein